MALRLGKNWTRLNVEKFEDRLNPDATFGWVVNPVAGTFSDGSAFTPAAGLYFRVDGDMTAGKSFAETFTVQNDMLGGLIISVATQSGDDDSALQYYLPVTAGEIAIAQQQFGTGFGSFKGVIINGGAGNDTIGAGATPYSVIADGGAGNDSLTGGNARDTLVGGAGNDVLAGNGSNDDLRGGAGNDTLTGGQGADTLDGGAGVNNLDGNQGNDVVNGGDGNETIVGSAGDDTINGNGGNDSIDGGGGNDSILGGEGNDTITATDGNDTLRGENGDDLITGGNGNNVLDGGNGNDGITSGTGADTITGGAGNDTINSAEGNDNISGGEGNDNIDSGTGDDTVIGEAGNDTVLAGPGNDNVNGGDGTDSVDGGTGADTLLGGAGDNDTVVADSDDIVLSGGNGVGDFLRLTVGSQPTLAGVINGATPGSGFESYNIDGGVNYIYAPSATELAATNAGGSLPAGIASSLNPGDGLSYQNAAAGMIINVNSLVVGALPPITNLDRVIGTPFADAILGDADANELDGGGGNDLVQGFGGNDTLAGGAGDDSIYGGLGDDTLVLDFDRTSASPLNPNDAFFGGDGVDTLQFRGVPDDQPTVAGIQPSLANLLYIGDYVADQTPGNSDYNTLSPADNAVWEYVRERRDVHVAPLDAGI